jgi:uncharacterized protein YjiS (DUF1127 family)
MSKLIQSLNTWVKREGKVRRTRFELCQLSDRELADIGINRCDIDKISREVINVAL